MKQSFDLNEKGRLNFTFSLVVSFHKDWQYAQMGKERERMSKLDYNTPKDDYCISLISMHPTIH